MQSNFVLDTNAYAMLFQMPRSEAFHRLEGRLKSDGVLRFFLPEIVSMEIHSVIGKYRRGGAVESRVPCERQFVANGEIKSCVNICHSPKRTRMKSKVFKALQKLMNDIEHQKGDIQATLLPLRQAELDFGKMFLQQHAHQFSFGSHDALVAGTVAAAAANGEKLTLVTSDKGLKALCRERQIDVFDPLLAV